MSRRMRTTVRLPPELLSAARRHARDTGRTFTALIEDALRLALTTEQRRDDRVREPLPTYGAGGLLPGVDLDDSARLLDQTDGD
jgi:predicted transcriptional regulator